MQLVNRAMIRLVPNKIIFSTNGIVRYSIIRYLNLEMLKSMLVNHLNNYLLTSINKIL